MCDYSLEMYASRPARESEKYVTTRFPSGSIGLAAPGDCSTAVCVLYDTKLNLEGISSDLQTRLGVQPAEQVVFARLEHGAYRDGVRFGNGKEISLAVARLRRRRLARARARDRARNNSGKDGGFRTGGIRAFAT